MAGVEDAGATDVGLKRKAEDNLEIFLYKGLPLTSEIGRMQFELDQEARRKNEAIGTKLIKGAEAAGVKAEGLARATGIKEKSKAEAFVMRTDASANADLTKANARKIQAEAAMLEFELAQKQRDAGMESDAKKPEAGAKKSPKPPETPEEKAERLERRRELYRKRKAAQNNPPTPPKGAK
jgi:hypothetical protein